MLTIWKYEIPMIGEAFALRMPEEPVMLTVQIQRGKPHLWAYVDTELPTKLYRFRLVCTGHPLAADEWLGYVGTFQIEQREFVYHVFFCREDAAT